VFYSAPGLVNHFYSVHGMQGEVQGEEDLAEWIEERHIHAGFQGSFWCGFCGRVVRIGEVGMEGEEEGEGEEYYEDEGENEETGFGMRAWEGRFGHIGEHFLRGEEMGAWVALED
jgi:hypothetical protein